MSDYEFGQKVEFVWPLGRVTTDRRKKEWQDGRQLPSPIRIKPKPQKGIIIGKRTLANGSYNYEEWGIEFDPEEYFTAYLIAFDMRRKPVYVKPENVQAL